MPLVRSRGFRHIVKYFNKSQFVNYQNRVQFVFAFALNLSANNFTVSKGAWKANEILMTTKINVNVIGTS